MPPKVPAAIAATSDRDFNRAAKRLSVVRRLVESGSAKCDTIDAARELGISIRTLHRLVHKFRNGDDQSVRCLLPKQSGPGAGARYLLPEAEAIIAGQISNHFSRGERIRIRRLYVEIVTDCRLANLPIPSYDTVRRRVLALPNEFRLRGMKGSKAAKQIVTPTVGTYSVRGAYNVLQIDHTPCDVIIVDRVYRLPIGRPWLTLAIDVATRMIAGFYLTLEAPSFLSTSLCLQRAFLPKSSYLYEMGFAFAWPCEGLPDFIHSDNGRDFRCINLGRVLTAYDIGHQLRPLGTPRYGGHIERLIGTCMGEFHFLPGTTFENAEQNRKRNYNSSEEACLTLDELEAYFCAQLNLYHNSIHSGISRPPISAWTDELKRRDRPLRSVGDDKQLTVDFLPSEDRTVTRQGIRFHNIFYWNSELSCLLGEQDRSIKISYDPRDMSRLYAILPGGGFIEAKFATGDRPPVTLWEVEAAERELRELNRGPIFEDQIFAMVLKKRQIIASAIKRTRKIRGSGPRQLERTTRALDAGNSPLLLEKPSASSTSPEPTPAQGDVIDVDVDKIYEVEDW